MSNKPHPQAISVQLSIAGFLSSTLILDWVRPGMLGSMHESVSSVLPILAPCLFGLMGFCLGAISLCRQRWFAIVLTTALAPLLGVIGAQLLWLLTGVRLREDTGLLHGAGIGAVFIPFVALTWLRMQPKGDAPGEVASHQRASWAIVLLALAVLQVFVAVGSNASRAGRTDASTAIGILAGLGLLVLCVSDVRAIREMRAALERADDRAPAVDPSTFERMNSNYAGNVACSIVGWSGITLAHLLGSPEHYPLF